VITGSADAFALAGFAGSMLGGSTTSPDVETIVDGAGTGDWADTMTLQSKVLTKALVKQAMIRELNRNFTRFLDADFAWRGSPYFDEHAP
jgi:hypothetical protein